MWIRENWGLIINVLIVLGMGAFVLIQTAPEKITAREDQCWLTNIDDKGVGFSFPTDYCLQLKIQCTTSSHNIPCEWWEDNTNKSMGSCVCEWWG